MVPSRPGWRLVLALAVVVLGVLTRRWALVLLVGAAYAVAALRHHRAARPQKLPRRGQGATVIEGTVLHEETRPGQRG